MMEKQADLPVINFEKYGQLSYTSLEEGYENEQFLQDTQFLGLANEATKQEGNYLKNWLIVGRYKGIRDRY